MKLCLDYTVPEDSMAADAIKGMVLLHSFKHITFCTTLENCDVAFFLISQFSNPTIINEKCTLLGKSATPTYLFNIHNKVYANLELLQAPVLPWSEENLIRMLSSPSPFLVPVL